MIVFAIQRQDGKWFKPKNRSNRTTQWFDNLDEANLYNSKNGAGAKRQTTWMQKRGIICKLVKFKLIEIMEYNKDLPNYGELIDVKTFSACCCDNNLIDYDGHGHPVKNNKMSNQIIKPSKFTEIPEDATHIMWFNK